MKGEDGNESFQMAMESTMANQVISFPIARRFAPQRTARFARRGGGDDEGRSIVVGRGIIVTTDITLLMRWGSTSCAFRVGGVDSLYSSTKEGTIEFGTIAKKEGVKADTRGDGR